MILYFFIPKGESLSYVIDELEKHECFSNLMTFKYIMIIMNKDKGIKPGTYNLADANSLSEFIELITSPSKELRNITILEGWDINQINQKFYKMFNIDTVKFKSLCYDQEFMSTLEIQAPSLEGYLYPDTYSFSIDLSLSPSMEKEIIQTLVHEFKSKYNESVKSNNQNINLSIHEVVTLASIIQGECVYVDEMYTVSSVYSNRLEEGWRLQADPTIQYIIPGKNKRLYNKDYKRISPYNTYIHHGLPPGTD